MPTLGPLATELRDTIRAIGPCTGLEAWEDIAWRITTCGLAIKGLRLLGRDPSSGLPRISRLDLHAALIEAEGAGGIHCANLRESGAGETYSWRPLPTMPAEPLRQLRLFDSKS